MAAPIPLVPPEMNTLRTLSGIGCYRLRGPQWGRAFKFQNSRHAGLFASDDGCRIEMFARKYRSARRQPDIFVNTHPQTVSPTPANRFTSGRHGNIVFASPPHAG